MVNDAFLVELKKFIPKPGIAELYKQIILEGYQDTTKSTIENRKSIIAQITNQNTKLSKARELLLLGDIDT